MFRDFFIDVMVCGYLSVSVYELGNCV